MSGTPTTLILFTTLLLAVARAGAAESVEVSPAKPASATYTQSPKGLSLATVMMKGSRWVVVVDGKEGPEFDEILKAADRFVTHLDGDREPTRFELARGAQIAFSPDGKRHAYAARVGEEAVVIVDGNEVYRGPVARGGPSIAVLGFTPDSKRYHFYAPVADQPNTFTLNIDGKQMPPVQQLPILVFSPDGSRFAYLAIAPGETTPHILLDGQRVDYVGERLRFSPDSKRFACVGKNEKNEQTLYVDGTPLVSATRIKQVVMSAAGPIGVVTVEEGGLAQRLYIDGQPVEGVENVFTLWFSPDGKRWAAKCVKSPDSWMVIDGKRGQNYQQVHDAEFTADSSRVIYKATAGNRTFLIVNGQEQEGMNVLRIPVNYSETGDGYLYAGGEQLKEIKLVHNDKVIGPLPDIRTAFISPDGKRHAFTSHPGALSSDLYVDGQKLDGVVGDRREVFFSPDGKHMAAYFRPTGGDDGLLVNDVMLPVPKGARVLQILGFSPDSKHIAWSAQVRGDDRKTRTVVFVDDKRVAEFDQHAYRGLPVNVPRHEYQPDGTLVLIGRVDEAVMRVTVPQPTETSIETIGK
jgi:dipeptidyl aminopeptidase/acylaminoacyl peptidase